MEPVQTLVPIAANSGKDPEVIDAAACTFLHEGREADLRCGREVLTPTTAKLALVPTGHHCAVALQHKAKECVDQ